MSRRSLRALVRVGGTRISLTVTNYDSMKFPGHCADSSTWTTNSDSPLCAWS
jgi:hypothetical protein